MCRSLFRASVTAILSAAALFMFLSPAFSQNTMAFAFKFDGSKVAFNRDLDRFVVTMGNRVIVITWDGDVFGHDVAGNTIGEAFKFGGSKVAFNRELDRFVVTMGSRTIVMTKDGDVWGHDIWVDPPVDWADMLNAHYEKRTLHCAPPLVWSPDLANAAQDYANQCILDRHGSAGENMADWVPATTNTHVFQNVWYCEVSHYNFDAPAIVGGFKRDCEPPVNGHFTQVVWRGTQQLGCGKATCTIGGQPGTHWVCRYGPPGNVNTPEALAQNVQRPPCR
jgi:Cysteine-rich secretory protein family